MNSKAFTLIELLVVIAIIGVLASIVLVSLSGAKDQAELAKTQSFARQVRTSLGLSLVGEWRFDDENDPTRDSSGYDNHGILLPTGEPLYIDGVFGKALQFDGSNDYVSIADSSVFNTNVLTISAWVKFSNDSQSFIFEKGNVNTQYSLFSHGTDIVFRTKPVGEAYDTLSTTKANAGITNDQWHFIIGTYDGAVKKLYVDGVLKLSRDWVKIIEVNNNGCSIGRFGGTTAGYYFTGSIDEVRIYNEALSLSQIQQFYAQGAVKHNIVLK